MSLSELIAQHDQTLLERKEEVKNKQAVID